jgi:multicomponent K+:H+ antiporter subunit D
MSAHLIILPILLPLAAAVILLLTGERRGLLQAGLAAAANVALLIVAVILALSADGPGFSASYLLGDWPARFGIVLVADRLSALMVVLASVLGLVNTLFAMGRWSRLGPYYQVLSQLLLMGLNGAFLTGDLFNLFVFFEILLAASYGLLLHGSGPRRVRAGLHYIVINLVASLLLLVGISLIFGVAGTLNMAALAERIPAMPPHTRGLFHAGAAILGVAFLSKAAAWPVGFWLPRTYDAATPAAAAMFAIMTKVGVYAILRLGLLGFGPEAGESAGFAWPLVFVMGLATLGTGAIGMLAARDLGRLAGYSVMLSAGTLLCAVVFDDPAVLTGALLYMVVSTCGAAAFYLMGGLIAPDGDDVFEEPVLEAYDPENDGAFTEEDERAVVMPASVGMLSAGFLICTLVIAGLPPLPGFLAKVAMVAPLLQAPSGPLPGAAVVFAALVVISSLVALIAMARAGVQILWAEPERLPSTLRAGEVATVFSLLLALLILTFTIAGPLGFLQRTAVQVLDPAQYVSSVLGPEGGS